MRRRPVALPCPHAPMPHGIECARMSSISVKGFNFFLRSQSDAFALVLRCANDRRITTKHSRPFASPRVLIIMQALLTSTSGSARYGLCGERSRRRDPPFATASHADAATAGFRGGEPLCGSVLRRRMPVLRLRVACRNRGARSGDGEEASYYDEGLRRSPGLRTPELSPPPPPSHGA